ncbi:hypothetical protein Tco_0092227 [Tanacetum coccineum]
MPCSLQTREPVREEYRTGARQLSSAVHIFRFTSSRTRSLEERVNHSIRPKGEWEIELSTCSEFLRLAGYSRTELLGTTQKMSRQRTFVGSSKVKSRHVHDLYSLQTFAQVADASRLNLEILSWPGMTMIRPVVGNYHRNNNNKQLLSLQQTGLTGAGTATKNRGQQATDLPTRVPSSPGYPRRVILTLFTPHVDVDTQESVVVLLVLASNVARLVIFSGLQENIGARFVWHAGRSQRIRPV